MNKRLKIGIDKDGFPNQEGVYSYLEYCNGEESKEEIDVYDHPVKGLCCWVNDYGGSGILEGDIEDDPHIAIRGTGLEFITKIRDLD